MSRAVALGGAPAALFTRARALEALGAPAREAEAWRRYLEVDRGSQWAEEARVRLQELEQAAAQPGLVGVAGASPAELDNLVRTHPAAVRRWSERWLLAAWAMAFEEGDREAAERILGSAEAVSGRLGPVRGRLLAASVRSIRRAGETGDTGRLSQLAKSHDAFAEGSYLYRSERTGQAIPKITSAIEGLEAAESPFALAARLLRFWTEDSTAIEAVEALVGEAEAADFRTLAAEGYRIIGYRLSLAGRLEAALTAYDQALIRFEELGEREEAVVLHALRAEILAYVGRRTEALGELAQALGPGSRIADAYLRYTLYVVGASCTRILEKEASARELRREAAEVCRDLEGRPLCSLDAWIRLAGMAPSAAEARADLERAERELARVGSSEGSVRSTIELTEAWAHWFARGDNPDADRGAAIDLLIEVAEGFADLGLTVPGVRARVERAALLEAEGQAQEAREAYRRALGLLRWWDENGRWRPEAAEAALPETLRRVCERLILLEVEESAPEVSVPALLLSEEMRDRLAPRLTRELQPPTNEDVDGLLASLPASTAVVELAVVEGRAVAWVLAGGRIAQVVFAGPIDLHESLEEVHSALRGEDLAAWRRTTGELSRALVEPVLQRLPAGTQKLVLVLDAELYDVPFRGLWSPERGRYLDEELALTLAPSLGSLLPGRDPPGTGAAVALPVLAAGFDKFPGLGLGKLEEAPSEAVAVAAEYGLPPSDSCHVTDWESLRRCLPGARVVHLATHAAARSSEEGSSWIAFPGEKVGLLELWRELPALPATELVVVSACESAATAPGAEGLGGLARPFLARGARAFVGSLWRLDDRVGAASFRTFHREYRRTRDAAQALRAAREELEGWFERPWAWAGLVSVSTELD